MPARTLPGLSQRLPFGDTGALERTVDTLRDLRVREARILLSWTDWERDGGQRWFDAIFDALRDIPRLRVIPVLFDTPPRLAPQSGNGPPSDLGAFAAFVAKIIDRYGDTCDWVQLWQRPNDEAIWDIARDSDGARFSVMATEAAKAAHEKKKSVALGSLFPLDLIYLSRADEWGLIAHVDAIAFQSPAKTVIYPPAEELRAVRALIVGLGREAEVWIDSICTAEAGAVDRFEDLRTLPADRIFWHAATDIEKSGQGLVRSDGSKTPLYSHWNGEVQNI